MRARNRYGTHLLFNVPFAEATLSSLFGCFMLSILFCKYSIGFQVPSFTSVQNSAKLSNATICGSTYAVFYTYILSFLIMSQKNMNLKKQTYKMKCDY